MSDKEAKKAINTIKAVYDDGEAEINGRIYTFNKINHGKRRAVFSFYSGIAGSLQSGSMEFLDTEAFKKVEKIILSIVTCNGDILSVVGDKHWETYPEDYLMFVTTALGVISYPFMKGHHTS